jgi:hypothetical protein
MKSIMVPPRNLELKLDEGSRGLVILANRRYAVLWPRLFLSYTPVERETS